MWVLGGGRDAPNPSSEVEPYEIFFTAIDQQFGSFLTPRRNFAVDGEVSCYMWVGGRIWQRWYAAKLDGILLLRRSHTNTNRYRNSDWPAGYAHSKVSSYSAAAPVVFQICSIQ